MATGIDSLKGQTIGIQGLVTMRSSRTHEAQKKSQPTNRNAIIAGKKKTR